MTQGEHTIDLGKRLTQELENTKYAVYKAHGNRTEENNVCRPTPFFGSYSTASTLSFVDVVVVNTENKKVLILCEIEESGASPKKVIGDLINIMISEKLRIKNDDYEYYVPILILGVKVREGGKSEQKIKALIPILRLEFER